MLAVLVSWADPLWRALEHGDVLRHLCNTTKQLHAGRSITDDGNALVAEVDAFGPLRGMDDDPAEIFDAGETWEIRVCEESCSADDCVDVSRNG